MSNNYFEFIMSLRVERGFSQLEIARKLGISRSSYIAFEQGKRELTLAEAGELGKIFEVSLEDIKAGKISTQEVVFEKNKRSVKTKSVKRGIEERISVPQEKVDKFKKVLLYILFKVGGKP